MITFTITPEFSTDELEDLINGINYPGSTLSSWMEIPYIDYPDPPTHYSMDGSTYSYEFDLYLTKINTQDHFTYKDGPDLYLGPTIPPIQGPIEPPIQGPEDPDEIPF